MALARRPEAARAALHRRQVRACCALPPRDGGAVTMSMNETGIGWTDLTWSVWSGCKKISAGCAHCWAESLTEQRRGLPAAPHGFDLTVRPKNLKDPAAALRRYGPSLIFCESMSDVGLD